MDGRTKVIIYRRYYKYTSRIASQLHVCLINWLAWCCLRLLRKKQKVPKIHHMIFRHCVPPLPFLGTVCCMRRILGA
uniref:Uncharacterized protein n=1 Tax=Arundo donax TaxID=35708 RepID=A0A0A9HX80_ARUDO